MQLEQQPFSLATYHLLLCVLPCFAPHVLLAGHHPRAAGGNGAPGGAVILRATKQLTGLGSIPLHVEAARGGSGGKQWMEGKRGADKVLDVPLGTLVWQLVEMKQAPGSTAVPHGVTPLPRLTAAAPAASVDAAVAQRHLLSPHLQQQHVDTAQGTGSAQSAGRSSSVSGSSGRRRLFPDIVQQQQQQLPQQQQQPHSLPSAAALGAEESSADAGAGDCEDALYDELRSCRRLLTNAEKLWLLNNGRLRTPQQLLRQNAAMLGAAAAAAAAADYADSDDGSDGDVLQDSDDEQLSDEEDEWVVLPPAEDDEAAAAAGEGGWLEDVERQFTKQQVRFQAVLKAGAGFVGR
jgi:hypothetical protein